MRLSSDETDPGYHGWKRWCQMCGGPLVFLDGIEQKMVETVDEDDGFIVRAVLDSEGGLIVENDEIKRETLYGNVEIRTT